MTNEEIIKNFVDLYETTQLEEELPGIGEAILLLENALLRIEARQKEKERIAEESDLKVQNILGR